MKETRLGDWGDCGRYALLVQRKFGGELYALHCEYLDAVDKNGKGIWRIDHVLVKIGEFYVDVHGGNTPDDIWRMLDRQVSGDGDDPAEAFLAPATIKEIQDNNIPMPCELCGVRPIVIKRDGYHFCHSCFGDYTAVQGIVNYMKKDPKYTHSFLGKINTKFSNFKELWVAYLVHEAKLKHKELVKLRDIHNGLRWKTAYEIKTQLDHQMTAAWRLAKGLI